MYVKLFEKKRYKFIGHKILRNVGIGIKNEEKVSIGIGLSYGT